MIGIDSWQNTLPNLTAIGTTNVDTVFSGPIDAQEGLKGDVTGNVNGNLTGNVIGNNSTGNNENIITNSIYVSPTPTTATLTLENTVDTTSYKIILDGTDIDFTGGANVNATATALHTALNGTVTGIIPSVTDAVVTLTKADGTDFIYRADANTFGILNGIADTNDITANNGTVTSFTKAQLKGDVTGNVTGNAVSYTHLTLPTKRIV